MGLKGTYVIDKILRVSTEHTATLCMYTHVYIDIFTYIYIYIYVYT